jgi:hypothetical protein
MAAAATGRRVKIADSGGRSRGADRKQLISHSESVLERDTVWDDTRRVTNYSWPKRTQEWRHWKGRGCEGRARMTCRHGRNATQLRGRETLENSEGVLESLSTNGLVALAGRLPLDPLRPLDPFVQAQTSRRPLIGGYAHRGIAPTHLLVHPFRKRIPESPSPKRPSWGTRGQGQVLWDGGRRL